MSRTAEEVRTLATDGIARLIRVDAGLSIEDAAAQLGEPATVVASWERASVDPSKDEARRYLALLVTLDRASALPVITGDEVATVMGLCATRAAGIAETVATAQPSPELVADLIVRTDDVRGWFYRLVEAFDAGDHAPRESRAETDARLDLPCELTDYDASPPPRPEDLRDPAPGVLWDFLGRVTNGVAWMMRDLAYPFTPRQTLEIGTALAGALSVLERMQSQAAVATPRSRRRGPHAESIGRTRRGGHARGR